MTCLDAGAAGEVLRNSRVGDRASPQVGNVVFVGAASAAAPRRSVGDQAGDGHAGQGPGLADLGVDLRDDEVGDVVAADDGVQAEGGEDDSEGSDDATRCHGPRSAGSGWSRCG